MSSLSAIHSKEVLLRLAFDGSPAGLIIADEKRRIVLVNQAVESMFGYVAEELLGRPLETLFAQSDGIEDAFSNKQSRIERSEDGKTVEKNTTAKRKDNTEFPIDISLHRIESEQEELVLANIIDATQRQRTEQDRANQSEIERLTLVGQLSGGVAHEIRTPLSVIRNDVYFLQSLRSRLTSLAELYRAKRQIRITQQKLVQSERLAAIGQMVTGLAHESRNALQRARSCLDLLELDWQGQSEQLDMTQRIREALNDLQRNYEEVRNYAAPIVLNMQQIDGVQILQRAFQDLTEEFASSQHRLIVHHPPTPVLLQADEFRLLQAFRNILENAMAASENNSAIEVYFRKRGIDGRNVQEVAFHDSGEGMDESTLSQLFEPFFTTKQTGTGLGMAICKRIIESHGGRIVASSVRNKGSIIAVMLPLQGR